MWLILASLRNPYMVGTIVFMILVLGVLSIVNIPVDILPVFKAPAVQVLTYYQGMPAVSVEKTLTNRVERWVNQAPGAESVQSKSIPGVSIIRVYFQDDIDSNAALTLSNSLAQYTVPFLPPNTQPPVVLPFDPTGTMPLGIITVSNPNLDEAGIKDIARYQLRNYLGSVPGGVFPAVVGGKNRTVLIYLHPKQMEARRVSANDVIKALENGNLIVTPGTAYFGNNQTLLDTNAMVKDVDELNDLPIRIEPGNNVYLRDIGKAEDSYAIQTSRVRINGRQQVFVPVYRKGGSSTLTVADKTRSQLPLLEKRLPEGTKLAYVMDQSGYVRESIHSLIEEGVVGAVLVSIMILVFLGNWRMTIIATLSIPLSVLGALTLLYATGNTVNVMTLGGLSLALGPLVDDAIVGLENAHRHMAMGKPRIVAAFHAEVEVLVPVMVATCTTVIVLAPLAFMPGMGGFLFRPLALAVGFAMLSSLLLSRTFVPMMVSRFLTEHPNALKAAHQSLDTDAVESLDLHGDTSGWHGYIERFLGRLTGWYQHALSFAVRRRPFVLGTVLLLFVLSLLQLRWIGREFFPQVDAGQITMYVRAPSNLRLDASEKLIAKVEKFVKKHIPAAEREMIVSEMGLDTDWSAAYTANSGQQDTIVRIQLNEHRRHSAQEYAIQLRHLMQAEAELSDLRVSFDTGGMVSTALNYGTSSPIDIQIEGGKREQGMKMAHEVRNLAATVRGAVDVRIAQRDDAPYLIIEIDRQKAADLGLSAKDVTLQVVAAMNSSLSISRNFWIDLKSGNQYYVAVQYPQDPNAKLEVLNNVFATGTGQANPVTLGSLVKSYTSTTDAVEVTHNNLARTYNVLVNTENRDTAGVAGDLAKKLKTLKVPAGMTVELRGEYARMNDSFRRLVFGLGMASLLVYLLLVALFRSWVGPFIIMFTVPLGLIGVLTMLNVTRTTLNVQSEMGVIFLVGIAVNNGVLLVDFANKLRKKGVPAREAIVRAASVRFRPIIMTFLATFLALSPMAIGIGRGSEATIPLARAVVGGLLTSTALTLFVVPILFTLLIRDRGQERDVDGELKAYESGGGGVPLLAQSNGHAPVSAAHGGAAIHGVSPHGLPA